MHRPLRQHREESRGVALIAVLWLLALLTLLATSAVALSASHRRATQRLAQAVELDARADSAIRLTLLRVIAPRSPNERVPVGASLTVDVPDGPVQVSVEREIGRVDINTASSALVFAVLAANGLPDKQAQALANRIEDWKDPDDTARDQGAERGEYAAAGLRYVPRNGPFESVEEVRQVLGAADIHAVFLNAFTVYSHAEAPPETVASEPVKRALALADERELDGHRWLAAREAGTNAPPTALAAAPGESPTLVGEVLRLRACAGEHTFKRCRLAIVRPTGGTLAPLQVFAWHIALVKSTESSSSAR